MGIRPAWARIVLAPEVVAVRLAVTTPLALVLPIEVYWLLATDMPLILRLLPDVTAIMTGLLAIVSPALFFTVTVTVAEVLPFATRVPG